MRTPFVVIPVAAAAALLGGMLLFGDREQQPDLPNVGEPVATSADRVTARPRGELRAPTRDLWSRRAAAAHDERAARERSSAARPTPGEELDVDPVERLEGSMLSWPEVVPVVDEHNARMVAHVLDEVVAPLTNTCIDLAQTRDPSIGGMLSLRFDLDDDGRGGSGISDMQPLETNEISDPRLLDCIRDSVSTATFPPQRGAGPEHLALSLTVAPQLG